MTPAPPWLMSPLGPRRTHSHLPCATENPAIKDVQQNPAIKDGEQNKDRVENQETVYEIAGIQYPNAETTLILFCSAPLSLADRASSFREWQQSLLTSGQLQKKSRYNNTRFPKEIAQPEDPTIKLTGNGMKNSLLWKNQQFQVQILIVAVFKESNSVSFNLLKEWTCRIWHYGWAKIIKLFDHKMWKSESTKPQCRQDKSLG